MSVLYMLDRRTEVMPTSYVYETTIDQLEAGWVDGILLAKQSVFLDQPLKLETGSIFRATIIEDEGRLVVQMQEGDKRFTKMLKRIGLK